MKKRIWKDDMYPARIKVKTVVTLTPETAVPVVALRDKLSIFKNLRTPSGWSVRFRASPQKWDTNDAELIVQAIRDAQKKPVKRPFNQRLFNRGRLGP